jgi:hypothetical protein
MGEVVDFKTRAKVATGPAPDLNVHTAEGNSPDAQAPPLVAGCLVLACPCGSCSMEMWAHGVIVCARCQRLCGSAVWNYTNRQGPADAERTPMPDGDGALPPAT